MAWASVVTLDQRSLNGTYFILELSTTDWSTTLNPGELAQVVIEFNYTIVSTTDNGVLDLLIETSADDTLFESESKAERHIITTVDDPDVLSIPVTGVYAFRIKARLRDNDDTAWSGDDTATLDVDVALDGVNI